uniref:Myosin binding protein C2 n=1 Tax=Nothoprocta perdicaria TaxID=30464 RepID=A0A8C6ZC46_NOTPE
APPDGSRADDIHPPEQRDPDGLFINKPQSVLVESGKDVAVVARVDGAQLSAKAAVKWFKGKWLELGSKSGTRFQFKEAFDKESKVYTFELNISKVVVGDRGDYRCEVTAKDKKDSCSFNIDVEGERGPRGDNKDDAAGELDFSGLLKKRWGHRSVQGRARVHKGVRGCARVHKAFVRKLDPAYQVDKGNKIKLVVELSDPDLPLKWYKNGQLLKPSTKYVFENVGLKRILTIHKCSLADDAAYECRVNDEKSFTEVFVKEPPVTIEKGLDDQQVFVGDRVVLEAEVSEEGAQVMWLKDGVELTRDDAFKYRFKKDGKKHYLIINEATKEDTGHYKLMTNGGESEAEVIVEEKKLEVLQDIADLTVRAAEQAVFKCEVSDEKVTGKWYKNGVEVRPSKRIRMAHNGRFHTLVIDDVRPEDEGDYTFIPDGYALSLSAKLNFLEIKVEYVPKQEPPKIHLDCSGKTAENTIVVVAGNKLRLDVPITGEPAPTVTWWKGEQTFTDTEGRAHLEQQSDLSSLVIESAERGDEGQYRITVTNPAGEDSATITIKVVDVPDPPEAVRVTSVGEDWATLVWEPPKFDGGQPVTGYLVERKKKGSMRWMKLNFEVLAATTFESTRMIEGVFYEMRVLAVNRIGVSAPSRNTQPFMPLAPTSEPTHLTLEDVTDTTATLKWRPPDRVGAGGIDGYLVEYCQEGSSEWLPANTELVERCGFTARGLPTGARLLFRVVGVNMAGRSPPATLLQPVTIREIVERPRIRLPRHLRQTYVRRVGEQVNLVVPFQGKPRPCVTWTKEGQPLGADVATRTSDLDTVFFIRTAARAHSGRYELRVRIENMEDAANINLRVVERPGPPQAVQVREVWGFNAQLEWEPPKDDGNSQPCTPIEWFTVYEHNRAPRCVVSELVMGNEYLFRVFSENMCGTSEAAALSRNTARIPKAGTGTGRGRDGDRGHRVSPLSPWPQVTLVTGHCPPRPHPPKVTWLKNQQDVGADPRFLARHSQGVLTLLIRKPGPVDGGTYGCRAVNEINEYALGAGPGGIPAPQG